jgi:hypothetical protein
VPRLFITTWRAIHLRAERAVARVLNERDPLAPRKPLWDDASMRQARAFTVGFGLLVLIGAAHAGAPKQPPTKPATTKAAATKATIEISAHVTALAATDQEAASRAAKALGGIDAPSAHDALLDALALGLPPAVAITALTALATHPAPPDVLVLKRYAGHHDPAVRAAAMDVLALYPDPRAHATVVAGLSDSSAMVRNAAANASGRGRIRSAVEPMLLLLARGDDVAARALGELATPELARLLGDQIGKVPEPTLALSLGTVLKRKDFGPDPARVEVVRALAKLQDAASTTALTEYVTATPKNPPRPSRQEAEAVITARKGGK